MSKYIIIFGCLFFPLLLMAQGGIVNNGANMTVMATTDIQISNGGVTNKANGTINNEGNIYLDLDWSQTGATTSYLGNGWMWFEGGANQNISSVSPLTVPKLRVDNGNRLILNNSVTVSTQVDLTNNGNIELGTNKLIINSGATIVNYDANNFVVTNSTGVLQQEVSATSVIFPVGNSTYNPATINNFGTTDNISVRVEDQALEYGTSGTPETQDVVNRSWYLSEEIVGGSLVDLTVQWDVAHELTGFDRSQCGVAHWIGTYWDHPGIYATATPVGGSFSRTRNGLTSFSPFVVEDSKESLPIELLFFEAHRLNKKNVKLDWSTESETNNLGFEIERMLDTETAFSKIAWVDGAGTTTSLVNYELNDLNPHQGVSYYRLKQIDFDGSFSYSPVRAVAGYKNGNNSSVLMYPVPVTNSLNLDFSNWEDNETDITIKIIDVYGRTLITRNTSIKQNTVVNLHEVQDLLPGTYFLAATSQTGLNFVRKFVKNEE